MVILTAHSDQLYKSIHSELLVGPILTASTKYFHLKICGIYIRICIDSSVFINRSSADGYTPPAHVDKLQDKLIGIIERLCDGHLHVQRHY